MPAVSVPVPPRTGGPRGSLYRKAYDFTDDWFSDDVPVWEVATAAFKGKPGIHYLEVGAFEGRSALWAVENILTDPTARATVIDPCLGEYATRLQRNIAKSGQAARIQLIKGYSQTALRALPVGEFEIVYIDGSHVAADVLEDAVLSWRLLKKGGLMIFDDYGWSGWKETLPPRERPGPAIDVFFAFFADSFDVVHRGYQVILRKR
jgi:predicted O-methyltransferase YrrM